MKDNVFLWGMAFLALSFMLVLILGMNYLSQKTAQTAMEQGYEQVKDGWTVLWKKKQ